MKKFKYTAYDYGKRKVRGVLEAKDGTQLRNELQSRNLYLVRYREVGGEEVGAAFRPHGMKKGEFSLFCRQFSVMVQAQVPILECLETLYSQTFSKVFRRAIYQVYTDVRTGIDLGDAFAKHPKVFPEYFVGMVRTGIAGGRLSEVLENAALYYENEQKQRKKLSSAAAYPIFVFILMVILAAILMIFVVPVFEDTFRQLAINDPPRITVMLFGICKAIRENAFAIAMGAAALIFLLYALSRTKRVSYYRDLLIVRLPFLGRFFSDVIALRFARGMGVLLKSGVDILEAFDTVAPLTCNRYSERMIRSAAKGLEKGESVYEVLKNTRLFPSVLLQMISVGEKSANMDGVLLKSCEFLDTEIENRINRFISYLQPALYIVMGGFVGLIFLSVYMPIIGIISGI